MMMPKAHVLDLVAIAGDASRIHTNIAPAQLIQDALLRNEGTLTDTGALAVTTGKHTRRSPKDKFIVDNAPTHDQVDWGKVNQRMSPETFEALLHKTLTALHETELYVFDGFGGADPDHRLPIRIVSQYAWHCLFATQLFVRATPEELETHVPHFTIVDAPFLQLAGPDDGVNSEVAIALDFERGLGLIVGTQYAGEIKKSIFTVLNFLLPQSNIFPMHCSANVGQSGDTALFFGLSGTGKTTLSSDPERRLIGDDEHGWAETGIFNFEGGCYAKCIHLNAESEPQIWSAIQFGSVLENVVLDPITHRADYDDVSLTENIRAAYPVEFIPNALIPGMGAPPETIFFLTADASGVLPPIARLTPTQALYHFLSGYTSKLVGTERGVTAPEPNFSACFGAPFWPLPPTHYARMLGEKLSAHSATCYLINTGWTGGPYGIGKRIDLTITRRLIDAALSGELKDVSVSLDPIFGLPIPAAIDGVPAELLHPRENWSDANAYNAAAHALAERFAANFTRFGVVSAEIKAAGPHIS